MSNDTQPAKLSGKSNFNMKVYFYEPYVDEDTGEVKQGEFVYVGKLRKQHLALHRNLKFENELDALLYELHAIQRNCFRVYIWDNNQPYGQNEVLHLERGRIKDNNGKPRTRLREYEITVRNLIPNYQFIPH